jgi:hypothetical protein
MEGNRVLEPYNTQAPKHVENIIEGEGMSSALV